MIRWWRRLRLRRQYGQLVHVIRRVEATQQALGWPRWKKQQWWKEFYSSPRGRERLVDILKGVGP